MVLSSKGSSFASLVGSHHELYNTYVEEGLYRRYPRKRRFCTFSQQNAETSPRDSSRWNTGNETGDVSTHITANILARCALVRPQRSASRIILGLLMKVLTVSIELFGSVLTNTRWSTTRPGLVPHLSSSSESREFLGAPLCARWSMLRQE